MKKISMLLSVILLATISNNIMAKTDFDKESIMVNFGGTSYLLKNNTATDDQLSQIKKETKYIIEHNNKIRKFFDKEKEAIPFKHINSEYVKVYDAQEKFLNYIIVKGYYDDETLKLYVQLDKEIVDNAEYLAKLAKQRGLDTTDIEKNNKNDREQQRSFLKIYNDYFK